MRAKKIFLMAGLISVGLAAMTSCKKDGGTTGGSSDKTIVFYHSSGQNLQVYLNAAKEQFEKENPGWTIDMQKQDNYDAIKAKITGDFRAGKYPSLAYCYADHVADYLVTKKVVDLNQFINGEDGYTAEEIADFVPGFYKEGSQFANASDKMYTLPFSKSTEVMYYNADVLEDLNLEVPTTWEEMWDVCKTIKESPKYSSWTPLGYDSEANWFITICEQLGIPYTDASAEDPFKFNNTQITDELVELQEYYKAGYFTTKALNSNSNTSNLLKDKRCVFSIGSTGGAKYNVPTAENKFSLKIAPIPTYEGKDLKCISQGPSLVMLDHGTEENAMTWKFMKLLLAPEFQANFSMTSGYMPVRKSSLEIEAYKEWLASTDGLTSFDDLTVASYTCKIATSLLEADHYYVSDAFKGSSLARNEVNAALVAAVSGSDRAAIEAALQKAYNNCVQNS